jgi:hypothetical protein
MKPLIADASANLLTRYVREADANSLKLLPLSSLRLLCNHSVANATTFLFLYCPQNLSSKDTIPKNLSSKANVAGG